MKKHTFECSDVNILNTHTIQITISKDPKTYDCGGYFEYGTISLPALGMLIRHTKTGYDFITGAIDRTEKFSHKITLMKSYKTDEMPIPEIDDTFCSNGYVVLAN